MEVDEDLQPLTFWFSSCDRFPKLFELAIDTCLSLAILSMLSHYTFSQCGASISPEFHRSKPSTSCYV